MNNWSMPATLKTGSWEVFQQRFVNAVVRVVGCTYLNGRNGYPYTPLRLDFLGWFRRYLNTFLFREVRLESPLLSRECIQPCWHLLGLVRNCFCLLQFFKHFEILKSHSCAIKILSKFRLSSASVPCQPSLAISSEFPFPLTSKPASQLPSQASACIHSR
jgi:hypothetical protein